MLALDELAELESTLLPGLERHHLRLLAHGLRTLQAVAGRREGACPDPAAIRAWCAGQPQIADDPGFAEAFATQMEAAARQLGAIASDLGCQPLQLSLAELAAWAVQQADQRLATPPAASTALSPATEPAAPPPG